MKKIGSRTVNLLGQKFGRLTVVEFDGANNGEKYRGAKWKCVCDCGQRISVWANALKSGVTQSCGCFHKEQIKTHGLSKTPGYTSWRNMIQRCYEKTSVSYERYGGRGISVCDRWHYSIENFFTDLGTKPSPNHSLERINNDGPYEPGNVIWATAKDQANNRRKAKPRTGPDPRSRAVTGRWSKLFNCCIECGGTERRHQGIGLCTKCHLRMRRILKTPVKSITYV